MATRGRYGVINQDTIVEDILCVSTYCKLPGSLGGGGLLGGDSS